MVSDCVSVKHEQVTYREPRTDHRLKPPLADYQNENREVWHVPWFVVGVLCWRHGYQRGEGAQEAAQEP